MELVLVFLQTGIVYAFLVIALRRLGRHDLAGLTPMAYLSIALLGSAVETALYKGSGSLSAGLVSAFTLIGLNRLLSVATARWPRLRSWLVGVPIVLIHEGRLVLSQLRRAHLSEEDVQAAVRKMGYDRLDEIRLAVLEVDGTVGVIPWDDRNGRED